ncbi:unnamed protein product [Caenorhabditis angaria]|uniref:Uncharacterized protein n=1 Tax=Caenorhabditis angaria TaxID=860376 RepID=A0A9P1J3L3_9PELO|nr:unnamed protein product [Caenorhabditis angaria]
MLRPSRSDPVLIKPSYSEFVRKWNNMKYEGYSFVAPIAVDQLYGIFVTIADSSKSVVSASSPSAPGSSATFFSAHNNLKMSKTDRQRREKKLAFQLKRRNSVLMANCREVINVPGGMRRAWSSVELRETCCQETTTTKRVSFSVNLPKSSAPNNHYEMDRGTYDLGPAKIPARPILRRTTYSGGKDSLEHMDFDMFTAWRRGSKMSDDCEKSRKKSIKEEESLGKTRREKASDDMCWIVRVVKMGFDSCFQRRRVTPSPPPTTISSNDELTTSTTNSGADDGIVMANAE